MRNIIYRLKQMPDGLRAFCIACGVGGPILVLAMILPIGQCWIDGQPVSHLEFWESGVGPVVTATGCVMTFFAMAVYRARRWVRFVIPACFLTYGLGNLLFALCNPNPELWVDTAGGVTWTLISAWYLNRKRTVAEYFATAGR